MGRSHPGTLCSWEGGEGRALSLEAREVTTGPWKRWGRKSRWGGTVEAKKGRHFVEERGVVLRLLTG